MNPETTDVMQLVTLALGSSAICLIALGTVRWLAHATANVRYNLLSAAVVSLLACVLFLQRIEVQLPFSDPVVVVVHVEEKKSVRKLTVHAQHPSWLRLAEQSARTIWAIGAGVVFLVFATHLRKYTWLPIKCDRLITQAIRQRAANSRDQAVVRFANRISVSPEIASPCIVGLTRGRILLPPQAMNWDQDTLDMVVYHESQHIRQFDLLRSLLTCLAVTLYWYNPLVWRLASRLFAERERACDERVVQTTGTDPFTYFQHVLRAVSLTTGPRPIPSVGSREQLLQRINWLTEPRKIPSRCRTYLTTGLSLVLLIITPCFELRLSPVELTVHTEQRGTG
jgi:beta-lactamase regulating signal transducer with metallopeptidase domain